MVSFYDSLVLELKNLYYNLGTYSEKLARFECDSREIIALVNQIPIMWSEQSKLFDSIFPKIAKHKYKYDSDATYADPTADKTPIMDNLASPFNKNENFYGLKQTFMPYPPILVLIPPLRYLLF